MIFDITYDENNNPKWVNTWDGCCEVSREFKPDEDGWMLDQFSEKNFPIIEQGRQVNSLLSLVNKLKRENFHLRHQLEQWRKAAGF